MQHQPTGSPTALLDNVPEDEGAEPSGFASLVGAARPRRSLPWPDLAVLGVAALAYFYFITYGAWWWHDGPRYFHELLGDAFAAGQLSLVVQPSPQLLALSDPYDPRNRENIPFLHDASLYQGKYYVYWGPFPGLVHAI